jgi:colanic acid/amylovoran biosynthesis protein
MDKHGSEWGDVYLDRLASAGRRLLEAGLNVCVIVHDQLGEDGKLAGELLARLADDRVRLCCEGDPLRMKKFISEARLLVGSRYHALVAALSTGVPVVALGWGHKYDMLLEDFGVPECLHPAASGQAHLAGLLDRLLDDAEWAGMHETIRAARRRMGGVNAEMWATVLSVLGLTRQADAP